MMTIDEAVTVLNRNRHRQQNTWRVSPRYQPSGFLGSAKTDEEMVECGDFRTHKGSVFILRATEALAVARYYVDRESGGPINYLKSVWGHYCHAWDQLYITKYDPEFETCTCFKASKPGGAISENIGVAIDVPQSTGWDAITLLSHLQHVINCSSAENGSDTPDFILARFLTDCLIAWDKAVRDRERWYRGNPAAL